MISDAKVIRLCAVVVRSLRKEFPEDFYKRCSYAAFGLRALLTDAGIEAEIIGGDFAAFIVSTNGQRAGMQGFGYGRDQSSHFWLAAEGRLLDIGPYLLPNDSSYPIAPLPFVGWDTTNPLPAYLRYRARERFPPNAVMSAVPEQNERCARFIAQCRARAGGQLTSAGRLPWLLNSNEVVRIAASRGDAWAKGALRFADMTNLSDLPF